MSFYKRYNIKLKLIILKLINIKDNKNLREILFLIIIKLFYLINK